MTSTTEQRTPIPAVRDRPRRKHHWWRWTVGGLVVVVAAVVARPVPASPPLRLSVAAADAPVGPLGGRWTVAAGSSVGFRVQETFLGYNSDAVGRTGGVTGGVAVSAGQITTATFQVDLTALQVAGKPQPQFAVSLDTRAHPTATIVLTQPVPLGPGFTTGSTNTVKATGLLTMHGVSRAVAVTVSGRPTARHCRSQGRSPSPSPTGTSPDRQGTASSARSPTTAQPSSSSSCTGHDVASLPVSGASSREGRRVDDTRARYRVCRPAPPDGTRTSAM